MWNVSRLPVFVFRDIKNIGYKRVFYTDDSSLWTKTRHGSPIFTVDDKYRIKPPEPIVSPAKMKKRKKKEKKKKKSKNVPARRRSVVLAGLPPADTSSVTPCYKRRVANVSRYFSRGTVDKRTGQNVKTNRTERFRVNVCAGAKDTTSCFNACVSFSSPPQLRVGTKNIRQTDGQTDGSEIPAAAAAAINMPQIGTRGRTGLSTWFELFAENDTARPARSSVGNNLLFWSEPARVRDRKSDETSSAPSQCILVVELLKAPATVDNNTNPTRPGHVSVINPYIFSKRRYR